MGGKEASVVCMCVFTHTCGCGGTGGHVGGVCVCVTGHEAEPGGPGAGGEGLRSHEW